MKKVDKQVKYTSQQGSGNCIVMCVSIFSYYHRDVSDRLRYVYELVFLSSFISGLPVRVTYKYTGFFPIHTNLLCQTLHVSRALEVSWPY